jgi:hypothetical protein
LHPHSRLSPFQVQVLEAFFRATSGFYLTGGAALAGFHLGHRETHDLDLFTLGRSVTEGLAALRVVAGAIGAETEELQTAPDFRRVLLRRSDESLIVDLAFERAPQLREEKLVFGTIRVDPPEEIFANKLCALLGRAEIRDLVDVRALEQTGLSLEQALTAGSRKDGGLTPAQLAWVLSQIAIGDDAPVPGGVSGAELRRYLADLIDRLATLARP